MSETVETSDAAEPAGLASLFPFDPFAPEFREDPYPIYRALREKAPAMHVGPGMWVATGRDECTEVLHNRSFGYGDGQMVASQIVTNADGERVRPFIFLDPPDHTRVRGLVSKAFTPALVERLRSGAQDMVRGLLADAAAKPNDEPVNFMTEFALILPTRLISDLLGMPEEEKEQFDEWSAALARGLDPDFMLTPEEAVQRDTARRDFDAYFVELAKKRRENPGEDLVSQLALVAEDGDRLTWTELASTCRLMLSAGSWPSAHLIGNGVAALLQHPEQLEWFRTHPDQVAGVVEELLRFDAPVQMAGMRSALEDTELAGQPVAQGESVISILGAANHDPKAFDDPDTLDVTRKPSRHMSFGYSAHFCVGAPLVRLSTQVALTELITRYSIERAPAEASRINNMVLRGYDNLPVFINAR